MSRSPKMLQLQEIEVVFSGQPSQAVGLDVKIEENQLLWNSKSHAKEKIQVDVRGNGKSVIWSNLSKETRDFRIDDSRYATVELRVVTAAKKSFLFNTFYFNLTKSESVELTGETLHSLSNRKPAVESDVRELDDGWGFVDPDLGPYWQEFKLWMASLQVTVKLRFEIVSLDYGAVSKAAGALEDRLLGVSPVWEKFGLCGAVLEKLLAFGKLGEEFNTPASVILVGIETIVEGLKEQTKVHQKIKVLFDRIARINSLQGRGRAPADYVNKRWIEVARLVMDFLKFVEKYVDRSVGGTALKFVFGSSTIPDDLESLSRRFEAISDDLDRALLVNIQHDISNWKTDHKTRELLEWLSPLDFDSTQIDISQRREEGTGNWFVETQIFQDWKNGKSGNRTLSFSGIPGTGKTILASVAVSSLLNQPSEKSSPVLFAYFDHKKQEEQTSRNVIGSLLRQLVIASGSISDSLRALKAKHDKEKSGPRFHELAAEFLAVVRESQSAYVVLDAIDECQRNQVGPILDALRTTPRHVRMLYMLRNNPELERIVGGNLVKLAASTQDMRRYIEAKIKETDWGQYALNQHSADREEVIESVICKANGMFLLVCLYMELLVDKTTMEGVRKTIQTLPESLDTIYDQIMETRVLLGSEKELARKALLWVVFASQPLSPAELKVAVGIGRNDESLNGDAQASVESLISLCAGLLVIDNESNTVRVAHETTQDYLIRTQPRWFPKAHSSIANVCLTHLCFREFDVSHSVVWDDVEEAFKRHPLLQYAALNWGWHARFDESHVDKAVLSKFIASTSCRNYSTQILFHSQYKDSLPNVSNQDGPIIPWTPADFVAFFGFTSILQSHSTEMSRNEVDSVGRSPFSYSAERGLLGTLQMLSLQPESSSSLRGSNRRSPLSYAAEKGHESVVRTLIQNGAAVDEVDDNGWTPLLYAAAQGYEEVARMLVENGAAVDERDKEGRTPLSNAAGWGYENTIQVLIEHGASVNDVDHLGRTPLSHAAGGLGGERENVIRILYEKGSIIDQRDRDGMTPLMHAASWGREPAMIALIGMGATVDQKDFHGRTPLSHAAGGLGGERESVLRKLLDKGAAVDQRDRDGKTPLMHAAGCGREPAMRVLIEMGALIDGKDFHNRTPLSHAASGLGGERESVTRMLIEKGAVIDRRDRDGRTPLMHAASCGRMAAMRVLIEKGAVVEERDFVDRTPLSHAAGGAGGEIETVLRMLIEKGAAVDCKDMDGRTPLSHAASLGRLPAVHVLIEGGAAVDARDIHDRTPLSHASGGQGGDGMEVTRILLEMGATIDSKDMDGRTPLSHAASWGRKGAIRALIENGAVVDSKDIYGRTPLSHAAGGVGGDSESVMRFLIEQGQAQVGEKDNSGRLPLFHAEQCGRESAIRILTEKGARAT